MERSRPAAIPSSVLLFVLGLVFNFVAANPGLISHSSSALNEPGHSQIRISIARLPPPAIFGVVMNGPVLGKVLPLVSISYLAFATLAFRRLSWARWPYMISAALFLLPHALRPGGYWNMIGVLAAVATLASPALLLYGSGAAWFKREHHSATP